LEHLDFEFVSDFEFRICRYLGLKIEALSKSHSGSGQWAVISDQHRPRTAGLMMEETRDFRMPNQTHPIAPAQ